MTMYSGILTLDLNSNASLYLKFLFFSVLQSFVIYIQIYSPFSNHKLAFHCIKYQELDYGKNNTWIEFDQLSQVVKLNKLKTSFKFLLK
jgi:hypothetical protein